jgi:hypothetical protein
MLAPVVAIAVVIIGAAVLLSGTLGRKPGPTASGNHQGATWIPGSPDPQGTLVPRGPLLWKAAYDGGLGDFGSPSYFGGDSSGVTLDGGASWVDFYVDKPDSRVRLLSKMPATPNYLAEVEIAVRPGSHLTARWLIRSGDDKTGDHVVALDSERKQLLIQYLPPGGASPEAVDSRDLPDLDNGRPHTLTADINPNGSYRIWLNQEQIADFADSRNATGGVMGLEVFGRSGEVQVFQFAAYNRQ